MISYIKGSILNINISKDSFVDILLDNGVGYRVYIPSSYMVPNKGSVYSLYIYHHVREDSQMLFGFEKEEERDLFEQLISVSGVGPRIGMAILSTFSKKDLESVIVEGDARGLSRVPGLGMKGAQKIILELRGKIDFDQKEGDEGSVLKELKEALKTLGFAGDQLKEKVKLGEKIVSKDMDIDIEGLIKKVLSA